MSDHRRHTVMGGGTDIEDTALALDATASREFFLNRLRMDVDALSHQYGALRGSNDRWNQVIMVISAIGALITSVLTIADLIGWPFEIVPIIIQTMSGVLAAWMRFYDFPKRMEAIINAKHASNDIRERLHKAPAINEELWEQYCSAVKNLDTVLTPQERDKSHILALKYMKRERVREAQLHQLLGLNHEQLLSGKILEKLGINGTAANGSEGSPYPSPSPSPMLRHPRLRQLTARDKADDVFTEDVMPSMKSSVAEHSTSAFDRPPTEDEKTSEQKLLKQLRVESGSDDNTGSGSLSRRPPSVESHVEPKETAIAKSESED